eukprot:366578-Chlamydomonas_euryale.AAC.12
MAALEDARRDATSVTEVAGACNDDAVRLLDSVRQVHYLVRVSHCARTIRWVCIWGGSSATPGACVSVWEDDSVGLHLVWVKCNTWCAGSALLAHAGTIAQP